MHYLFSGEDAFAKDTKLAELKQSFFFSPQAEHFDYEVLHAHKLKTDDLKKALMALPAVSAKRLIVLRDSQELSAPNKKILLDFFSGKTGYCSVVLDYFVIDWRSRFLEKIKPFVKVFPFSGKKGLDVFKLMTVVADRKTDRALQMLSDLLSEGDHPLRILGGMAYSWRKKKNWMPFQKFEKGLKVLQAADLNIKRSRMRPEHALEMAVVKLCQEKGK